MTRAFQAWIDNLLYHRIVSTKYFKALCHEWTVQPDHRDAREANNMIKVMDGFQCARCSLWYLPPPPGQRVICLNTMGQRVCFRCSGVSQP